jgi:hypothetical protein
MNEIMTYEAVVQLLKVMAPGPSPIQVNLYCDNPMKQNKNYTSPSTNGVILPTRIVDPFKPFVPRLEEILHILPNINRYNGATERPYSVAEHCVNCAIAGAAFHGTGNTNDTLYILLHDCAEAYLQDLLRPIKRFASDAYLEAEARITRQVYEIVGVTVTERLERIMKEIDTRMAVTEITQFIPHHTDPLPGHVAYSMELRQRFLLDYKILVQSYVNEGSCPRQVSSNVAIH